jgi:crotonobetainyl-CoA:carnitine CoA-transferase CaiB-like acyl-CoA transferase
VLERPDLVARKEDPGARDEVAAIFAGQTAAEWESRFRSSDACVERVLAPAEALESSRAYELPFGTPERELGAAPELGEHNKEILRELGDGPGHE